MSNSSVGDPSVQSVTAPALALLLEHTADVVQAVRGGRSLAELMPRVPEALRPGVQSLAFTTLRRLGGALAVRAQLAPRTPAPAVEGLLLSALALLWPSASAAAPYADHTLVDQAVAATRRRAPAAAGFVNAVLRRFVRERAACVAAAEKDPSAAYNHPQWWVQRVREDWPQHWIALLQQANQHPPMTLRVNARRSSGAAYLQLLAEQGLPARLLVTPALAGQAVVLEHPRPVQRLPGFAEGTVSVQDAAAQLAAPLLLGRGLRAGARVLDACAAPGGKAGHLLELADLNLLALDADAPRLARVQENLSRLKLAAELRSGDARTPRDWWDGQPFDAILLDAPCTASGIVRRHPDVRWLRRPEDLFALARVQAEMLDALWPLLRPGGRLLYATCSIFRAEGQQQIDAFLQRIGSESACLAPESPGHLLPVADNSVPGEPGVPGRAPRASVGDGFFYALIEKT